MNYQQQAEQEMWDAASHKYAPHEYRYEVQVPGTGAICMRTDSLPEAQGRANLVDGTIIDNAPATDEQIDRSFDTYR